MNDQNFVALCNRLADIKFLGKLAPPPPWGEGSPSVKSVPAVRTAVASGKRAIPDKYVEAFIAPLRRALPRLVEDATTLETLAGAVYQHGPDYDLTPQLRRFLAVVSDLFHSFLAREKREKVQIRLRERLPPLAAFKYVGDIGPFTFQFEQVRQDIRGRVAVVSLPATYADHPLLWALLAHETGGHDVVHAVPRLFQELQGGVGQALENTSVPGLGREELIVLWKYWMDEAVADAYGLLNVGPAFGLNLAAYHAACWSKQGLRVEIPKVRMGSTDEHPPAILRIHLAIGVVESLAGLSEAKRNTYIDDLKRLAVLCASAEVIQISCDVPFGQGKSVRIEAALPLGPMLEAARQVGQYIATVKLPALRNHSIQDIETWDDADEARAREVKHALAAGKSIVDTGDDAQLLAGATMYLLDHPNHYARVAKALAGALDHSFATDPIWGRPRMEPAAVVRVSSTSRQTPVRAHAQTRKPSTDRPAARSRHK